MGYTTVFRGHFSLDRPLTPEEAAYLHDFARTRRVRRESSKTELRPDPVRTAVGLPVGIEGGYFVGETGFCGQDNGPDVIDFVVRTVANQPLGLLPYNRRQSAYHALSSCPWACYTHGHNRRRYPAPELHPGHTARLHFTASCTTEHAVWSSKLLAAQCSWADNECLVHRASQQF